VKVLAIAALGAAFAAWACAPGSARAEGVLRVQQSDGTVRVYRRVHVRIAGSTLWLRSPDGHDELKIESEACSYAGPLERCFPYDTTLRRRGVLHHIALERGTVYANLTGADAQLPHSSQHVGPLDVLVQLHTTRGTYLSLSGTLDDGLGTPFDGSAR
jgi:hypothetical protein